MIFDRFVHFRCQLLNILYDKTLYRLKFVSFLAQVYQLYDAQPGELDAVFVSRVQLQKYQLQYLGVLLWQLNEDLFRKLELYPVVKAVEQLHLQLGDLQLVLLCQSHTVQLHGPEVKDFLEDVEAGAVDVVEETLADTIIDYYALVVAVVRHILEDQQ